jgi:hypothetical protein
MMDEEEKSALPLQFTLFPRKELVLLPRDQKNTGIDNIGNIIADDDHRYVIKGDAYGKSIRASEWICTAVAEFVGITAPQKTVIERPDGTLVFGSRAVAQASDQTTTTAYLMTPSAGNSSIGAVGLGILLSRIFALDLFLFNDDRHLGNYLSIDDNGTLRLYAFDFSRALFWHWPFEPQPSSDPVVDFNCNTRRYGADLRQLHGFDLGEALNILSRLEQMSLEHVNVVLNSMPEEWLSTEQRDMFLAWWSGDSKRNRINLIRSGIADESLL